MKIFNMKFILMLVVATLSLGFVSCGDDDDNKPSSTSLVGTWVMEVDDLKITVVFNSNGSGTFLEEYEDGSQYSEKFEYAYDASERVLTVVGTDVFDGNFDVVLTTSALRLTDEDGYIFQFKRK